MLLKKVIRAARPSSSFTSPTIGKPIDQRSDEKGGNPQHHPTPTFRELSFETLSLEDSFLVMTALKLESYTLIS